MAKSERIPGPREANLREFLAYVDAGDWQGIETSDTVLNDAKLLLPVLLDIYPHLENSGWIKSRQSKRPLDSNGRPLPWITYPAIQFLKDRLPEGLDIFEFGSGNSTLWWSKRAKHVTSVEHTERWAEEMRPQLPSNVEYHHIPLEYDGEYCRAAKATGRLYDLIVVDGRDRVRCIQNSVDSLKPGGVFIWDNTERARYQEGYDYLQQLGFRTVGFRGFGPSNVNNFRTSIFYRNENLFGL